MFWIHWITHNIWIEVHIQVNITTLLGCEVTPDVNLSAQKYNIKLFVPSQDGLSEVWVRCDDVSNLLFLKYLPLWKSTYK